MSSSLRDAAAKIGLSGNFFVLHDFFGHISQPTGLSLRTQVDRLISFRRIDMNMIRVGVDQFTFADLQEVDSAVRDTRDTYAQVSLAIGCVLH